MHARSKMLQNVVKYCKIIAHFAKEAIDKHTIVVLVNCFLPTFSQFLRIQMISIFKNFQLFSILITYYSKLFKKVVSVFLLLH